MLHQPIETFEPSQPLPPSANPFDPKRYIQRARDLGIMVYPTIGENGLRHVNYHAYPGYSFGKGHRKLCDEFDDTDGRAVLFDELCEDFGVDATDERMNGKVDSIRRARCRQSTDGDRRLIELCKKARVALGKDLAATCLRNELNDKLYQVIPARPFYTAALGAQVRETKDSRVMKEILADGIDEWSRSAVKAYRERIAAVVAYEKECARLSREIGLVAAERVCSAAGKRTMELVGDIAELPATTMLGLAYKGAILSDWKAAGYGLMDEGELLAFSIADDARMIGTSEPYEKTVQNRKRRQPPAQVHH